ncbi:MAG: antibiotic biosynthesis monooxygenase [Oscillospiraceae bacterium]|jgi:quinol monooxygenase YgiN|nr:antibiotic biosynthesis monooxygenase [Oscillospiraceae bacterium]
MSIRVVAGNYVREDAVEDYLAVVRELVEKTNELDRGCVSYQLARDLSDPLHFAVIEEWEDQASLDAHMKSEHFTRLIPELGKFGSDKPGGIALYERVY